MGKITKEELKRKKKEYDRMRREQNKSDPLLLAKLKEKERLKYLRKIEKGQVKAVNKMTSRELRKKRKQWKENSKNYREKKNFVQTKLDVVDVQMPTCSKYSNDTPVTSQSKVGRRKILRNRSKTVRELKKMKHQILIQKSRAERYKQRYLRLMNKNKENTMSPDRSIKKLLKNENVSPVIRKRLIFGEALHSQLKANFVTLGKGYKLRRKFYAAVSGNILRKYKRFLCDKSFLKCKSIYHRYKIPSSQLHGNQLHYCKITKETVNDVQEFFERDDVSRMCPGKKDCISRNKVKKQKRVLNDTIQNLHKKFKSSVSYKISYATFCRLRPFWVTKPKVTDRETCKCMLHSNMEMLISKMFEENIILYKTIKEVANNMCCNDNETDECLLRKCIACKDNEVKFNCFETKKDVKFKKWMLEKTNYSSKGTTKIATKPVKKEIQTTALNLVKEFKENINRFLVHLGNIKHQYTAIADLKNNLQSNEILIHIDFSENYSCKYSEEIQSVHFGGAREQITLHTGVLYQKQNDVLTTTSFATASKSLRHDASAIWAHLQTVSKCILQKPNLFNAVHMLSDGPCTQYRNKKMFYLLLKHTQELFPGIQNLTWNYTEAGHGKGAPDGVGGTLKRTADRIVAEGKDVNTFDSLINVLKKECTGIKLFPIDEDLINKADNMFEKDLKPFLGTLKVHQVLYDSCYRELDFRSLSCFKCKIFQCTHFQFNSERKELTVEPEKNIKGSKYEVGEWVMVEYDKTLYPGEILSINSENYIINVMVPSGNHNRYKWPSKKDIHTYSLIDIKCKLPRPTPCDNRASQYTFL